MNILNQIKHEVSTVQLIIFAFLGASFNSIILDLLFLYLIGAEPTSYQSVVCLCIAFSFPILYSMFTSYSLPEKRIVPPLLIQLNSIAIINIFEYLRFYIGEYPVLPTETFAYIVLIVLFSSAIAMMAWVQDWIVTKSVGLAGSKEDMYFFTHKIENAYEEVKAVFDDEKFQRATALRKKSKLNDDGLYVFCRLKDMTYQVFAFIARSRREKDVTILNILSYEKSKYGIKKGEEARLHAIMITHLLRNALNFKDEKRTTRKPEYYHDCIEHALKPTKNYLEKLGIRFVGLLSISAILSFPFVFFYFDIIEIEPLLVMLIPMIFSAFVFIHGLVAKRKD